MILISDFDIWLKSQLPHYQHLRILKNVLYLLPLLPLQSLAPSKTNRNIKLSVEFVSKTKIIWLTFNVLEQILNKFLLVNSHHYIAAWGKSNFEGNAIAVFSQSWMFVSPGCPYFFLGKDWNLRLWGFYFWLDLPDWRSDLLLVFLFRRFDLWLFLAVSDLRRDYFLLLWSFLFLPLGSLRLACLEELLFLLLP